jgi:hypothetical protein
MMEEWNVDKKGEFPFLDILLRTSRGISPVNQHLNFPKRNIPTFQYSNNPKGAKPLT